MIESLSGFVVIGVGILTGYLVGRAGILGAAGSTVIGRLAFFVLTPFLLFVVLAGSRVESLFSSLLAASALVAAVTILSFALVSRFVWKRSVSDVVIGALSSGQVNANQIGIPLSLYLLGSASYPAPVVLFQLLILTPISVAILESAATERRSVARSLGRAVTNPIVIGAVLGTLVSLSGVTLPALVMDPARLIADGAVPLLLIGYGMSLHGQSVLSAGAHRRDVLLASGLKLVFMPVLAWVVAALIFRLDAADVLVIVVLAALPTAQNVFNFAQRYETGVTIARDSVFITTIGCVPVLLLVTVFLPR